MKTYNDFIQPICFYLPQFHATPENNAWWGEGFTEWTNVKNAKDNIVHNHNVLHPSEATGYYDLLNFEVRKKQAETAKKYGIKGFCYHHYFFEKKLLLEKPLELMLQDGEPNLPFCLHWANEPWTKRWDGRESDILMQQNYGDKDTWEYHFNYLLKFFKHENYIKHDGKPVFLIYRIGHFDRFNEMFQLWNTLAQKNGLPGIEILAVLNTFSDSEFDPKFNNYVDGWVEYHPNHVIWQLHKNKVIFEHIKSKWQTTYDINHIWHEILNLPVFHQNQYLGIFPTWDNTPRRKEDGTMFLNSSPDQFENALINCFQKSIKHHQHKKAFFFINAWNEWAEGCAMEPSKNFGDGFLMAVKNALDTRVSNLAYQQDMVPAQESR